MQWIQHMLHFIQEIKGELIINVGADLPNALHIEAHPIALHAIEADHQDTADQKDGMNPLPKMIKLQEKIPLDQMVVTGSADFVTPYGTS